MYLKIRQTGMPFTQILCIFPVLNCNNFGSNKGIVIKLTVMFRFVFEAPTAGLPSAYYISRNDHAMGCGLCGGEGLSRDHLYNVGPGPKVHFVAVTKP